MTRSRIEGRRAVVAGADHAVGQAIAEVWAANGGVVVPLEEAASEEAALARLDRLDVLFNARAVPPPRTPLAALDETDWTRALCEGTAQALRLARAGLPHLRRSDAAAIVHVTSLAGESGAPGGGAWAPAQAALLQLTRQMALEWAREGVRVNAVAAGWLEADGGAAQRVPLRRLGRPEDVAHLAVFLASPAASFITAQVFACDGGLSQSLYAAAMTRAPEPTA